MLFNSFAFLLLFLPITLFGFYAVGRLGSLRLVLIWLILASFFFHAYWKASYTWLLALSLLVNYTVGLWCAEDYNQRRWLRRTAFASGLIFNLGTLGYFKYAAFIASSLWSVAGVYVEVGQITLPLAISFYTFQQIAFISDRYTGLAPRYSLLQYASYLAFFPHLIAGPIVRYDSLIPQLSNRSILKFQPDHFMVGAGMIIVGLTKKVVLADSASLFVDPVFLAAQTGAAINTGEAWLAAVLFSMVIYFDFSGYSDIAIGLACLFNVRFPENFASPYQAGNVIDFWRRWHITLSKFLRDYVYIPLGGSKQGRVRQFVNLFSTMALGGLWHGAGWNFVLWGCLHGAFLTVAHVFRGLLSNKGLFWTGVSRAFTFTCVVVAWVLFRSDSIGQATAVYAAMLHLNGGPSASPDRWADHSLAQGVVLCLFLLVIVHCMPNSQQIFRRYRPALQSGNATSVRFAIFLFRPTPLQVGMLAAFGMFALTRINQLTPFIYFRF